MLYIFPKCNMFINKSIEVLREVLLWGAIIDRLLVVHPG